MIKLVTDYLPHLRAIFLSKTALVRFCNKIQWLSETRSVDFKDPLKLSVLNNALEFDRGMVVTARLAEWSHPKQKILVHVQSSENFY